MVVENSADDIQYSNLTLDREYHLNGYNETLSTPLFLYQSRRLNASLGTLPQFSALNVTAYQFLVDGPDDTKAVAYNRRDFKAGLPSVDFSFNHIQLSDLKLNPLNLTWANIGNDAPKMISGIIADSSFTQTYAFMSMDPDVLEERKLRFPLDNVPLLADSTLFSLTIEV